MSFHHSYQMSLRITINLSKISSHFQTDEYLFPLNKHKLIKSQNIKNDKITLANILDRKIWAEIFY